MSLKLCVLYTHNIYYLFIINVPKACKFTINLVKGLLYIYSYMQCYPDMANRKEISKVKILCNNCEVGCEWTGIIKDLEVSVID